MRSLLPVVLSLFVVAGCPGPVVIDAAQLDAPMLDAPTLDAPTLDASPRDAPADAALDTSMDAWLDPDGPYGDVRPDGYLDDAPARCGYSEAAGTFECGATDPWPSPPCEGGVRCCVGICDPFGTDEVCCDPTTGRIEIYRYSAGDCPLAETIDC